MSNADQAFCPFPRRSPHEIDHAVFGNDKVDLGPRVGNGRSRSEGRQDTRFIAAGLLIVEGRAKGDDALAARRTISAVRKVELAAAAADLLRS